MTLMTLTEVCQYHKCKNRIGAEEWPSLAHSATRPSECEPRHPVTRVRVPELSSPSLAYLVLSLYRSARVCPLTCVGLIQETQRL
ncbi:hypothetical protein EB796_001964 [Bugula neritina]|uniref:Uncharacterized protein n=1 Tax=Bugula neritina TaxID=10212 RepID=A0A7J7KNI2_BUGNE|nr:hypothetical protein EB796_001964 [Bugula neritina]